MLPAFFASIYIFHGIFPGSLRGGSFFSFFFFNYMRATGELRWKMMGAVGFLSFSFYIREGQRMKWEAEERRAEQNLGLIHIGDITDEVLDSLLDQEGLEVDPVDRLEGDIPLHKAVRFANGLAEGEWGAGVELVELLLDAGADPRFVLDRLLTLFPFLFSALSLFLVLRDFWDCVYRRTDS